MRGLGVTEALEALPGVVVVCFALLTQLGDVWFLSILVGLTYWVGPHLPRIGDAVDSDRAATVLGLLLLAFVTVAVGKSVLGLPRPAGASIAPHAALIPDVLDPVYAWLSTGDGFGFPSGHATGSTLVYGGLAWAIRAGSRRQRAAVVAALVAVVSLSRLVLGVHYLVDVLAGMAIALVLLAAVVRVGTPGRVFGAVVCVGVLGALFTDPSGKVLAATGAAVGGGIAWHALGGVAPPSRDGARLTVLVGAVTAVPLLVLASQVHTVLPVVALLGLIGGALAVAMPLVGERLAKKSASGDA